MDDPYRRADRIDAQRLIEHDPYARAFMEHIAHIYLQGSLTVAEMRALMTLGIERGMMLETRRREIR